MSKRILIAEDDAVIRDVLKEHLENEGYEVLVAADGKEAVEIAKAHKPDLIIMDLFMPEMDGWEATRVIKFDKSTSNSKVICLSAYTSPEYTEKSKDAFCDLLLIKPIYPDVLKRHIAELLES
jgi:CheY-like chemotaxis protein